MKNEEGNRLKSGAQAFYESTPLSYANKGADLDIKQGDVFFIKFKNPKNDSDDVEQPEQDEENAG